MLRAIRESPAEVGPRFMYATRLAAKGDPDRAEFIRVQCHIAKLNPAAEEALPKDLRAREQELLTASCARQVARLVAQPDAQTRCFESQAFDFAWLFGRRL